jgi:hypothetical protein
MDSFGSRYGPVPSSCEHSNEHPGSINGWELLDQLSDYKMLKNDSSPWSWKAHHSVHKLPPLDPILSQMNPVHRLSPYYFLRSHLHLGLPSGLLLSGFPTENLYTFIMTLEVR